MFQLLEIHSVTKRFEGVVAVKRCTLKVRKKMIRGLIGPNGAGKTTLLNVISGFYKPDEGEIYFENKRIDGLKPYEIAKIGIGRTFQIPKPFRQMSVMDNMIAAGITHYEKREELESKAVELLKFFDIYHLRAEFAENLSGGQKKLLGMARALVFEPDLMLLDEPFHGVHPAFKTKIIKAVQELSTEGKTFVIVSHDIPSISETCHEISVLSAGALIAEGAPEGIRKNQKAIVAYLGVCVISLTVKDVVSGYSPEIDVLCGISLCVEQGKMIGVIGPNGAGKSTIIKTICGFFYSKNKQSRFKNKDITGIKPHVLARMGITYIAQERNIFPGLTVEENLKVYTWPFRKQQERVEKSLSKVYEIFPTLIRKLNDTASSLSGGQQRMLELGRVFIQNSELVLIDEPTAGLAPKIAKEVYEAINKLKEERLTVLLVDQNVRQAVKSSDYLYMLRSGRIFKEGPKEKFESELKSLIREWV